MGQSIRGPPLTVHDLHPQPSRKESKTMTDHNIAAAAAAGAALGGAVAKFG